MRYFLVPAVLSLLSVAGCRGELVSVGRSDGVVASATPRCNAEAALVSLADGAARPGSSAGPETLAGNRLVFFRADVATQRSTLVVADLGGTNERVLDTGSTPYAVAATATTAFWVDSGAKLRAIDLTTALASTVDDTRRLDLGRRSLAVSARGSVAYTSTEAIGGARVSTVWRRREGQPPEPVRRMAGPITDIFLTSTTTLLVSAEGNGPARLHLAGALDDLPALAGATGDAAPFELTASAEDIAAFDGIDVFSVDPSTAGSWASATITAWSLVSRTTRTVAEGLRIDPSAVRSLALRGDELLFIEADRGTSYENDQPHAWVMNQAVRSVRTAGGPVRTLFSDATRLTASDALAEVLVDACGSVAVVDATRRVRLVQP